jgi:hypothetical protein
MEAMEFLPINPKHPGIILSVIIKEYWEVSQG